VVARCNNRDFAVDTAEDVQVLLAHLRDLRRTDEVTLYAYTLMANHLHLLVRAPEAEALGRPLRWFRTETAEAVHQVRSRRGRCWARRYRAVLVADDRYAPAALRYLDRNPVRAGLVDDPPAYPWSSCAAYACGAPNPLVTFHPSYLGLSPYQAVRQRHYRALLAPRPDPVTDAHDPRWTTQRAVGTAAFVARVTPRRGRRKLVPVPPQIQARGADEVTGTFLTLPAVGRRGRRKRAAVPPHIQAFGADEVTGTFFSMLMFLAVPSGNRARQEAR
jgi:putative transposase